METRFKKKAKVFDICITAVAAALSVGIMIYGVFHFGLKETWPELVLNLFYIACLVMMWMYFFNIRITSEQFNYWTSVCVGMTILLRDILFLPPLAWCASSSQCISSLRLPTSMPVRSGKPIRSSTCGPSSSST